MNAGQFELLLFTTDENVVRSAFAAGVDGIIVDWERTDKARRQASADTEINRNTPADLRRVRRATKARVVCRINAAGPTTEREIEIAIAAGVDEVLLPMVRAPREVSAVLDLVRGRCGVGMLIETMDAMRSVEAFADLPLTRVFVGLNDLSIERRSSNLFEPVLDRTVENVRHGVRVPFGFGGLTLPEGGHPVPCRLLMGEMARLECRFSFLRRSFHRDLAGRSMTDVVSRIRDGLGQAFDRRPDAVERDRLMLEEAIAKWGRAGAASQ